MTNQDRITALEVKETEDKAERVALIKECSESITNDFREFVRFAGKDEGERLLSKLNEMLTLPF